MLFGFHSLKNRLLFTFSLFTILIVLLSVNLFLFLNSSQRISNFRYKIENALLDIFKVSKYEQDFFYYEMANPEIFQEITDDYLQQHNQSIKDVKDKLEKLSADEEMNFFRNRSLVFSSKFGQMLGELNNYQKSFDEMVRMAKERGFRDEGLIGKMRNYIHLVEADSSLGINLADLYLLRRHEKDYIIRKDTIYVNKLFQLCRKIESDILHLPGIGMQVKVRLMNLLQSYRSTFNNLVAIESLMGLNNPDGKRKIMRQQISRITLLMEDILKDANDSSDNYRKWQLAFVSLASLLAILASVVMSYFFSNLITRPVKKLSENIHEVVNSNFSEGLHFIQHNSKDEVGKLIRDFNLMLEEIRNQLRVINEKNNQLEHRNDELNALNQQLSDSENRLNNLVSVKDKFFSIISHDLRSPLTSMIGFLQILEKEADAFTKEETRQFASEMVKSVHRVLNLLENLLQWSLSQTGEIIFKPVTLNLKESIEEIVALYQKTASEKEIMLAVEADPGVFVKADKNMLQFILRNLLSNAIKFSYKDSEIYIAAKENGSKVEISINDQGVGMDQSSVERLFKADQHFSRPGTSLEKGTGFGLLLCKNFVEIHQGVIKVKSKVGVGTSVTFTLEKVSAKTLEAQAIVA